MPWCTLMRGRSWVALRLPPGTACTRQQYSTHKVQYCTVLYLIVLYCCGGYAVVHAHAREQMPSPETAPGTACTRQQYNCHKTVQ